jgi:drug/metabolite transporter (DMT)-like permease
MLTGMSASVAAVTAMALVAFASNSILCRLALKGGTIDAASFTAIRLVSGAVLLAAIVASQRGTRIAGTWSGAAALFAYAILFSFAYLAMGAGAGALVLFGAVQVGMIGYGLFRGERIKPIGIAGVLLAIGGLVWLLGPGLDAPPALSAAMMAGAGFAWAAYSIIGKSAADPVADTAGNFVRAAPASLIALVPAFAGLHVSPAGAAYAVLSGAITSGLGYVAWYAALRSIDSTRAGVLQLSVPVIAAAGGIAFLGEPISLRLIGASLLTLGGVSLVLLDKRRQAK